MPPKFNESAFKFSEEEKVPDHIEGYPGHDGDPKKYRLDGEDTFSGETYPLAVDIDDLPTAVMLQIARERQLEEDQPTSSSGGQTSHGIQDKVHIRSPQA